MKCAVSGQFCLKKITMFTILIIALMVPLAPDAQATNDQELENLQAFTRLYGYARFFHPSDAGANLDWENFAILGARRVRGASDTGQLQTILQDLFNPVAPTLQVFPIGENPSSLVDTDASGEVIAWQHLGVGFNAIHQKLYRSIRTGRSYSIPVKSSGFGTVTQCLNDENLQGKEIRLSARVRAEVSGQGNGGQLWLRVDRPKKQMGFFDNMSNRQIKKSQWKRYEIVGKVADDAVGICFGCFLKGQGRVWADEVKLEIRDAGSDWTEVTIKNPGFEEDRFRTPVGWNTSREGYTIHSVPEGADEGKRCVSIISKSSESSEHLFDQMPSLGECVEEEIGGGLACRVPLALGDEQAQETGPDLAELLIDIGELVENPPGVEDEAVRLAGVVIAWNVFQNFYPYFDVIDANWEGELPGFLRDADAAADEHSYFTFLRTLVAKLEDGHGSVSASLLGNEAGLDCQVDCIEDRIAVVGVPDGSELLVGDVIVSVDGVDAMEVINTEMDLTSGSEQWRCKKAAWRFGVGPLNDTAELIVHRGRKELNFSVGRHHQGPIRIDNGLGQIQEIKPGIWYVNLDVAEMDTINAKMEELATAKGVIFDLRGYPKGNHDVIRHLLTEDDTSDAWMLTPQNIYPNQRDVQWRESGWHMTSMEPHIQGKVVFLTDGRAISYAESFMGFIEHYKLAEIVGQPTAGANGNVNSFSLPGGFKISWTGMRVLKHDGGQHHTVGIIPTIPLDPSLEALIQGRDEYVEKALEILGGTK